MKNSLTKLLVTAGVVLTPALSHAQTWGDIATIGASNLNDLCYADGVDISCDSDIAVNGAVALDIDGSLKISNGGETCAPALAGSLRYNATSSLLEFCNGTAWTASSAGGGEFLVDGNVVRNQTDIVNKDFLFGSTQLADTGDANHDARMFFDKSKGAFRVGTASGDAWDDAKVGINSIAMGVETVASGYRSTAFGQSTLASGQFTTAFGNGAKATGDTAVAFGGTTLASGTRSASFGRFSTAGGENATSFGENSNAASLNSLALGRFNVGGGNATTWVATDPLFEIGIGADGANRANAVTVLKNGNFGIGKTAPASALDVSGTVNATAFVGDGSGLTGVVADSVVMGINGLTDGISDGSSVFLGKKAGIADDALGNENTAIGSESMQSNIGGTGNTAMGHQSLKLNKTGGTNTAIGWRTSQSNVSGSNNTAVGATALGSNTNGDENTAVGRQAFHNLTTGSQNLALGYQAGYSQTAGDNNIAIGARTNLPNVTGSNQLNIGNTIYGDLANDRIGIGKTAPASALDVSGTVNATAFVGDGSGLTGLTGEFEVDGTTVRNRTDLANNDFVFGSTQLADTGDANHDSRMFFDKSKGAFRAGRASSSHWDDANVGEHSVALGLGTRATGDQSFAMGDLYTFASGKGSVAFGSSAKATGNYSFAFGDGGNVNSSDFVTRAGSAAFAFGPNALADGYASLAFGRGRTTGEYSTSIGYRTKSDALLTSVFGRYNVGGGNATSWVATDPLFEIGNGTDDANRANAVTVLKNGNFGIGKTAPASALDVSGTVNATAFVGDGSGLTGVNGEFEVDGTTVRNRTDLANNDFVFGSTQLADTGDANHDSRMFFDKSKGAFRAGRVTGNRWDDSSVGNNSVALGFDNVASGADSIALGGYASASGSRAIALGQESKAEGLSSVSIGFRNTASGTYSVAIGRDNVANSTHATALGRYNVGGGDATNWVATDPLFEIGNGTDGANRANAVTVLKNGNVGIGVTAPTAALDVTGTVNATAFVGDGSGLTGVTAVMGLNDLTDARVENGSTYIGANAAPSSTLDGNVIVGSAGAHMAGARHTTILGAYAGQSLITGAGNTLIGREAMAGNSSTKAHGASYNTAIGFQAMRYGFGNHNVAIGRQAFNAKADGNDGVAIGKYAAAGQTAGDNNIAIGANTDLPNLTGSNQLNIGNTIYGDLANDRIGIGKTAPASALDVSGTVNATAFVGDGSGLTGVTGTPAGSNGQFQYNDNGTLAGMSMMYDSDNHKIYYGASVEDFVVDHNPSANYIGKFNVATGALNTETAAMHVAIAAYNGVTDPSRTYGLMMSAQRDVKFDSTPIPLRQGDLLPGIGFAGLTANYKGKGVKTGAAIHGVVDGVVSTENLPAGLRFSTSTGSGITERLRISSNGNVGIGTSTPQAALDVAGTFILGSGGESCIPTMEGGLRYTTSGGLEICDGSAWGAISGGSGTSVADADGNTKIQVEESANDDTIRFDTAGTERLTINATGVIEAKGFVKLNSATGGAGEGGSIVVGSLNDIADVNTGSPTNGQVLSWNSSAGKWQAGNASAAGLWSENGGNINFTTGNVGIGTATPGAPLTLEGGGNDLLARFQSATKEDVVKGIRINAQDLDDSVATFLDIAVDPKAEKIGLGIGSNSANLPIAQADLSEAELVIDSAGNVGIGTDSPARALHVNSAAPILALQNSTHAFADNDYYGYISGVDKDANETWWVGEGTTGEKYVGLYATRAGYDTRISSVENVVLRTNGAERLRVDNTGNVGIGVTAPSESLDVSGDVHIRGTGSTIGAADVSNASLRIGTGLGLDANEIFFNTGFDGNLGTVGATHLLFWTDGTERARLAANGNFGIGVTAPAEKLEVAGNVKAASFINTSDRNLKENIEGLTDALDSVTKLRGVRYDFKQDTGRELPTGKQVGLVAQEVKEVFPEVVHGEEGSMSVNYAALVAPLIEAVKEQQAQIEALKAEVEKLKSAK